MKIFIFLKLLISANIFLISSICCKLTSDEYRYIFDNLVHLLKKTNYSDNQIIHRIQVTRSEKYTYRYMMIDLSIVPIHES